MSAFSAKMATTGHVEPRSKPFSFVLLPTVHEFFLKLSIPVNTWNHMENGRFHELSKDILLFVF